MAQLVPRDFVPKPFPDLNGASDEDLIGYLQHPSAVYRLHSQWELVRRGPDRERMTGVMAVVADGQAPLYGRVAALYTLAQVNPASVGSLSGLYAKHPSLREFVLRATTERRGATQVDTNFLLAGLKDSNPRVRAQALISLGRLGDAKVAAAMLPLTVRETQFAVPTKKPLFNEADPGRVIPHLAVQALVAVGGVEACLKALDGPYHDGAQWALKYMHRSTAVAGLIKKLSTQRDEEQRRATLTTLVRLYHREADYKGDWLSLIHI